MVMKMVANEFMKGSAEASKLYEIRDEVLLKMNLKPAIPEDVLDEGKKGKTKAAKMKPLGKTNARKVMSRKRAKRKTYCSSSSSIASSSPASQEYQECGSAEGGEEESEVEKSQDEV